MVSKKTARPSPSDPFLQELALRSGVFVGRGGRRARLRRWLNILATPIRFPDRDQIGWQVFLFVACLLGGYGALVCEERSPKVTAVLHPSRRAGLDLHAVKPSAEPCWKIVGFWAWPIGQSHGKDVITEVLAAADATRTRVMLTAANQRLARGYYAALGFVVDDGEERVTRPRIVRQPRPAVVSAELERVRSLAG